MKWKQKHTSLLVIAIGFAVLYFFLKKEWLLVPVGMSLVGFFIGPMGELIHLTWMMITKVLAYVNSRIMLSILFFLLLSPLALIRKLFQRKQENPRLQKSFFAVRNYIFVKKDLETPW